LALCDGGVKFIACEMPEVNDLTVGIMALVAEAEREAISRRRKEALAVAKARGVRLGNPNGAKSLRREGKGCLALRAAVSANAKALAADLVPVPADIQASGHTSLRTISAELTARGLRTRRGGALGKLRGFCGRQVVRSGEGQRSATPAANGERRGLLGA